MLITHYSEHEDERNRLAQAARKRVLSEHTYDIRMSEALDHIFSYETGLASRRNPDHIDNLFEEAGQDPELTELFSKYGGEGIVTIDDIAAEIEKEKGEKLLRADNTDSG